MIDKIINFFTGYDPNYKPEKVSFTKKELGRFLLWSVIITVVTLIIGMPFIAIISAGLTLCILYELIVG